MAKKQKDNWYKSFGNYDSIIFVPCTPGTELRKMVQESLKDTGMKIKVVEKPGQKMVDIIKMTLKKPARRKCSDGKCLMCQTDKGGNCRKSEITYKIECKDCRDCYFGQSGQNGRARGGEHLHDYESDRPEGKISNETS